MTRKGLFLLVLGLLGWASLPSSPAEARYYHPTMGMWVQRDPIGYVDSMSLHLYAEPPTTLLDPWGLASAPAAQAAKECKMDAATKIAADQVLKNWDVRCAMCEAWKKTAAVPPPDVESVSATRGENSGYFEKPDPAPADGEATGPVYKHHPDPPGKPGGGETSGTPFTDDAIMAYHTHPDGYRTDPEEETHKPRIGGFGGTQDVSGYSLPSYKGHVKNDPTNTKPGDIELAAARGVAAAAVDRYYTYLYQGDGCVWVYPHPCVYLKPDDPVKATTPVLDRGLPVTEVRQALQKLAEGAIKK